MKESAYNFYSTVETVKVPTNLTCFKVSNSYNYSTTNPNIYCCKTSDIGKEGYLIRIDTSQVSSIQDAIDNEKYTKEYVYSYEHRTTSNGGWYWSDNLNQTYPLRDSFGASYGSIAGNKYTVDVIISKEQTIYHNQVKTEYIPGLIEMMEFFIGKTFSERNTILFSDEEAAYLKGVLALPSNVAWNDKCLVYQLPSSNSNNSNSSNSSN